MPANRHIMGTAATRRAINIGSIMHLTMSE